MLAPPLDLQEDGPDDHRHLASRGKVRDAIRPIAGTRRLLDTGGRATIVFIRTFIPDHALGIAGLVAIHSGGQSRPEGAAGPAFSASGKPICSFGRRLGRAGALERGPRKTLVASQWVNRPEGRDPCLVTMTGHRNYVNACAFSPDGSLLASGAHGGHVKLWEAATGQEVATLTPSPNLHAGDKDIYHVYACAFSPEGKRLMAGGANGVLKIWDVETRQAISLLAAEPRCDSIIACAFRSREGRQVVALCRDGSIYSWSLETGRVLAKLSLPPLRACTEDGELLELRSGGSSVLSVFRIGSREETVLAKYRGPLRAGDGFWDRTLAFSPDGGLIALWCEDDKLRVWDTRSGDLMGTLQEQVSSVRACIDSPAGARIAFTGDPPSAIKLWSVRSGTVDTLRGHQNGVRACVFSPDANFLASASWDWTLKLWDIAVRKESVLEPEGPTQQSTDSEQWLPPLWAWSEARGVPPPLWTWSEAREIPSRLVKPGNKPRIIVRGGIPKFEILDLNTGRRIETEGGHSWVGWHEPVVNSVAVAPDGRLFASADRDRWLKLWEVSSGKLLASFPVPGGFGGVAFNHRGTLLRCEALGGNVYILRLFGT